MWGIAVSTNYAVMSSGLCKNLFLRDYFSSDSILCCYSVGGFNTIFLWLFYGISKTLFDACKIYKLKKDELFNVYTNTNTNNGINNV